MRKMLIVLLTFVASAIAADVTGTWSGTLKMKMGEESRDDNALLILKQSGGTITGTVGPNDERRYDITKGTIEGDTIHLEANIQGDNKLVFDLKMDGEKLTGNLKAEGPEAPPLTGTMTLDKKK
jgi:hypothetical protein